MGRQGGKGGEVLQEWLTGWALGKQVTTQGTYWESQKEMERLSP